MFSVYGCVLQQSFTWIFFSPFNNFEIFWLVVIIRLHTIFTHLCIVCTISFYFNVFFTPPVNIIAINPSPSICLRQQRFRQPVCQKTEQFLWTSNSNRIISSFEFFIHLLSLTHTYHSRVPLGTLHHWDMHVPRCQMSSQKQKACQSLLGSGGCGPCRAHIPSKHGWHQKSLSFRADTFTQTWRATHLVW